MEKLIFLFAVHNHQPLGNFPDVFRRAFDRAYFPFLETVSRFPRFRFALHFSGFLWDYLLKERKDCLELIKNMVNSGQLELLGGGYYEPVLTQIPERDRLAQLSLMTEFLQETFGVRPEGLWLTERVWEPHLASLLHRAGFRYTLLDEEHFRYAGLKNIHGYYITEDEGLTFSVFPIDKTLRYYIPFRSLPELKAYFEKILNEGNDTAIIGDDGEKFGLWPGTDKWVYEDGWLVKFLEFLENSPVEMMTFGQYLKQRAPLGRAYLPPASYEEMMEWVLNPEDQREFIQLKNSLPPAARRFLRGGLYRDFSLKYPESHHLRCRQLQVSAEVSQGDDLEARRDLYQAQCNDAYWHGVFGGLYLPHLRRAVYEKLISAELKIPFVSGWERFDFDLDGHYEYSLKTPSFFLWIKPEAGGGITEIDDRHHGFNLTDVLTRRPEFYHLHTTSHGENQEGRSIHELSRALPPEAQKWLKFDNYRRLSFLERVLPAGISHQEYEDTYFLKPGEFIEKPFTAGLEDDTLILERQAEVNLASGSVQLRLRKRVRPGLRALLFVYEIDNLSAQELELTLTSEWNLAFFENEFRTGTNRVEFRKGELVLEAPEARELWVFPIKTVSQSEKDYEIITQGFSFHPVWRLKLAPREKKLVYLVLQHGR
ncbi:MAG: Alpha-amylase / alpha-mannosidase, GH57 family [Candidatus Saccharicenans subterraneus]|uniref:Alpha-amylase / alpha-mannosidase, GH57 family n=1 Tax=Candidatus Saccharicenans subterraneus TaxID=2508984 RepID=A0A3E2BN70_9BACT|nr:MAG: Alpha-amylase / alpha-mannosidase, GH57 family [Candidatus Saccharicenans subterraneum]